LIEAQLLTNTGPLSRTDNDPWFKVFVDNDARFSQFLCPLSNMSGISQYRNSCPLI